MDLTLIQRLAPGAADPQVKVNMYGFPMKNEGAAKNLGDANTDFQM